MFDRLDEIERRWRFVGSRPWQKASHPEGKKGYRIRDGDETTIAYVPDPNLAEALARASTDMSWLLDEVATLRKQVRELGAGGGARQVVGKSRQADITLATFKIEGVETPDDEV